MHVGRQLLGGDVDELVGEAADTTHGSLHSADVAHRDLLQLATGTVSRADDGNLDAGDIQQEGCEQLGKAFGLPRPPKRLDEHLLFKGPQSHVLQHTERNPCPVSSAVDVRKARTDHVPVPQPLANGALHSEVVQ